MECKQGIQQYSERIAKIQIMLDRINTDVTALEQCMDKAEEDLGYNDTGIKGFFKPLLGKIGKTRSSQEQSDDTETIYTPKFKADDYFGAAGSGAMMNETQGTSKHHP